MLNFLSRVSKCALPGPCSVRTVDDWHATLNFNVQATFGRDEYSFFFIYDNM